MTIAFISAIIFAIIIFIIMGYVILNERDD